jgi:hypothetical protein
LFKVLFFDSYSYGGVFVEKNIVKEKLNMDIITNNKLNSAVNYASKKMYDKNLFIKNDCLIKRENLNNVLDLKLFNTLIFLITNKEHIKDTNMRLIEDEGKEYYKMILKYSELRKILQFSSKKGFYKILKNSIFNLSQPFKIEYEDKTIITSLLWKSEFEKYNKNGAPIEYNEIKFLLDKKIFDEIINFNNTFTILDIQKMNSFHSLYALKLSELIIKYNRLNNIRFFTITLNEFNEIFKTNYKYITHTRNIINNAIKNIKEIYPEFNNLNVVFVNSKVLNVENINGNLSEVEEHIAFIFGDYNSMKFKKPLNYTKYI